MIAEAFMESEDQVRQEALDAFLKRVPAKGTLLEIATLPTTKWNNEPEVARISDGLMIHYFGLHHGNTVLLSKQDIRERPGGAELLKRWETLRKR